MNTRAPDPATTLKALQLFQQAQQLHAARQLAPAAEAFRKANALLPDHPGILVAYAALAEEVQDWVAAEKLYRRIGALRPNSNFEGKLGAMLFKQERYDEAIPCYRTHLGRHPSDPDVLYPLGLALCSIKAWEEALAVGRELERVRPGEQSMDLIINSLFNLGRKQELDTVVETALVRHPDSALVLSLCAVHLQKAGDYRRGFAYQHQVRWRYEPGRSSQPFHVPEDTWDGQPFDGLLLVSGEQGLGEEILAASMFGELERLQHDKGQRIVVACEPRLLPLFHRSFPTLDFVGRNSEAHTAIARSGDRVRRAGSLDLAVHFRRQTPLPDQRPWLRADSARVDRLRAAYRHAHPGCVLAGVSWKSTRQSTTARDKSVSLTDLGALLSLPRYAWYNVQYGDVATDLAAVAALGLTPPGDDPAIDPTNDLDGLAAQLTALDVIVTTSNTTAHIAGALGLPCHLLLSKTKAVLWYWGYDGTHTPWYPSIRIHRNPCEDEWLTLAAALARELGDAPTPP